MPPISAIAFDAFGTLIQYGAQRTSPYRRLIRHRSAAPQELRSTLMTRNVSVDILAQELGLAPLIPVIRQELEEETAALQLFPEVALTLQQLRAAGKPVALCSNLAYEYGPAVRRLLPELDAHILSFEVGAAKPEPAIYQAVCEGLNTPAGQILFIGDSQRCDLHGPQAFGMQARWLNRGAGHTLLTVLSEVM